MGEIKRTFKYFTIMEYEEEQEYLRKMQKDGWQFKSVIFPGIYTFEKCEPMDVVYQLDYNKEGLENKLEYVQMFEDCGWEYIYDYVGYSYFRKPVSEMKNEEEIFNDQSSKMDMLQRVYKGRMVPLFCIFTAIICPQLVMQSSRDSVMFIVFFIIFILYVAIFIKCGKKYKELKKREV